MTSENYNEAKSQTVKFNEVGDFIKGTLTGVDKMTKVDQYGKLSTIYTIKAKEGKFLGSTKNEKTGKSTLDKEATIVKDGEEYTMFLTGISVGIMKKVQIGQKFMIKLTELKPTDKGNDAKIKKIFPATDEAGKPVMDAEWIKEQKDDEFESTGY